MDEESRRGAVAVGPQVGVSKGSVGVNPTAIMKGTMDEVSHLLTPGQVVGDPLTFGEVTIIPLVSIGFGFGAGGGGGSGTEQGKEEGQGGGGGGGGGGGIRPIAVIIIDKEGARLAPIPDAPSGLDRLGAAIGAALEKRGEKSEG